MRYRRNLITILLLSMTSVGTSQGQEAAELPFFLPTPEGWRTETLPFPLDFAPELDYEGLEELRFAPGMFQEKEADFWSYAFVWWVPKETEITAKRLERDLEAYFRGLTRAVAQAREFDPGTPEFEARLEPRVGDRAELAQWSGSVRTYDAFTTRSAIGLGVQIDVLECPALGHLAVFFQLSPQPRRNRIWEVMDSMREGFRCPR